MTIFQTVKSSLTPRQVAEHCGITVRRNGMIRCPFHDDRHPSMKLNEEYFFCFGCGKTGDVIDLAAKLFGCSPSDAAHRLASDFGITAGQPSVPPELKPRKTQDEQTCFRELVEYLHTLQDRKARYAPQEPEDTLHPCFLEAIQELDYIEYLVDLLINTDDTEQTALVKKMMNKGKIEQLQNKIKETQKEREHEEV